MADELTELLDTAIYREIASQAFYIAGQSRTGDPGAQALMKELAEEERKHSQWLKDFKGKGLTEQDWHQEQVPNLMIGEYLTGGYTLEGAGLQDTLLFAVKREQQAVEFYSKMTGLMRNETARQLCEKMVNEEMKHKQKLEKLYDDMLFGGED
jgi:rubrerythrin